MDGRERRRSVLPSLATVQNTAYVQARYDEWRRDAAQVSPEWQAFFQGFELSRGLAPDTGAAERRCRMGDLVHAYRSQGYRAASVDPLGAPGEVPELDLERHGFDRSDLDREFENPVVPGPPQATLREILRRLRRAWCGTLGVEFMYIGDPGVREWWIQQVEGGGVPPFPQEARRQVLELLVDAVAFETFLQRRYPGQKRFSLEGAEALIPALHAVVELAPDLGVEEIVLGMAHRGRLNVLANILDKSYAEIFAEFQDNLLPNGVWGDGDVRYHKGYSSDHVNARGGAVHLSLTANPSHLEAVDPVVEGKARAKQRQRGDTAHRRRVLPLLVHGDAAFAGQGIVAETLNLSRLEGYRTGGTLHVVVNNGIGFTTRPEDARSTRQATDVARVVEAPILHVNADDPEAVVFAMEAALRFRLAFGADVVVDLRCYRRHGHNESDEPAFTQPLLYRRIQDHPTVRERYTTRLVQEGVLDPEDVERISEAFEERLRAAHQQVQQAGHRPPRQAFEGLWAGLDGPWSDAPGQTTVPVEVLRQVGDAICHVPEGFRVNRKIQRQLAQRREILRQGTGVDWGLAEALAFGSLLVEGTPVRLSGQDSARGTFSQRHARWRDEETEAPWVPLNHVAPDQAAFCVYDSSLSEAAVLGFDYGYSLAEPRMLILWEAQFGDFANGAQVVIDQFVVAAQSKWGRASGIVLLLPHGYEGQGPEHSNAYVERYLAACAEDNIQVVIPTTPAQYFHVLRRQVRRDFRRPLVCFTPKGLLRHPAVVSDLASMATGGFEPVLVDGPAEGAVRRVVMCSGRIYWDLADRLARNGGGGVVLVRVEQLYPLPGARLQEVLDRTPEAELVWAQEEPMNRGPWSWIRDRLVELVPGRPVRYAGRKSAASPATGSAEAHRREQEAVLRAALEPEAGVTRSRQPMQEGQA